MMEDSQIIELYFARDEAAISETSKKYGSFCHTVAMNILSRHEDAEECVNDTYLRAWNAIPPQRPNFLRTWLGRIVRNLSLDRWHKCRAKKRYAGIELLMEELEECIPAPGSPEQELEAKELAEYIDRWLAGLGSRERVLFVRRYWNGEEIKKLAQEFGMTANQLTGQLYRLRAGLKVFLEKEGVAL